MLQVLTAQNQDKKFAGNRSGRSKQRGLFGSPTALFKKEEEIWLL